MSTPLETAARPDGLRRVAIDPVSRVEGHGKVTLLLDEHNRVQQARLHIVEFRGFERFIEGRPYWEVPVMVQRLCGICPVSHHLAASKAIDHALGIRQLTPAAELIRRLMHYGQVMQSHALHFFHLSSPDLLFGFDADPALRNIVGVAAAYPDVARQGVALRRYGQEVIRVTAGKKVHGTGSVPGGVNKPVTAAERDALRAELPHMRDWAQGAVELARRLVASDAKRLHGFANGPANMMSLVAPDGSLDLYDGVLRVRDETGRILVDGYDVQGYLDLIEEETRPWTYLKFPYLRSLGPQAGWYRVGPLARVQNAERLGTPLADAARADFLASGGGQPVHAVLATHWARMIEMLHALERIEHLLDTPELLDTELRVPLPTGATGRREGVGVIEAPRGTLIHHYVIGEDDLIAWCNLIVSTTHNNQAMNEAVRAVARDAFDGRDVTEGLLNHIEVAIRAYDPCLSCATHALGRMPLEVRLERVDGSLQSVTRKHADGSLETLAPEACG